MNTHTDPTIESTITKRAALTKGQRVRALYPNARLGTGTVVELVADTKRKPLVVKMDSGNTVYFHANQVEAI